MKRIIALMVVLGMGSLFLTACGEPTDREQILDAIKVLARLAEERDIDRILDRLDERYGDFKGRSKAETKAMLGEYLTRYHGIVVNILKSEVEELSAGDAVVRADLAFSSGAIKAIRKFAKISLDNYGFKIKLRKTGMGWLVTYAEWRPFGVNEIVTGPE